MISKYMDGGVFDFGCGEGGALNFFLKQGFQVFSVDIAEKDLEVARRNIQPNKHNQTLGNLN